MAPPLTRNNKNATVKNNDTQNNTPTFSNTGTPKNNALNQPTLDDVMRELREVKESINFMSTKYDELIIKVNSVMDDNKKLHKENQNIINHNSKLQEEVDSLTAFVNDTKQYDLKNNVVIFGLPPMRTAAEAKTSFAKIMQKVDINEDELGVVDIYQKKNSHNNTVAPIVVKFQEFNIKNNILQLMKTTAISTKDIGLTTTNRIRITDQLTPFNQQLLNEAKQLRSHGYKYIWYKHGKIMIRKNSDSEIITIKSLGHIETLKCHNITL